MLSPPLAVGSFAYRHKFFFSGHIRVTRAFKYVGRPIEVNFAGGVRFTIEDKFGHPRAKLTSIPRVFLFLFCVEPSLVVRGRSVKGGRGHIGMCGSEGRCEAGHPIVCFRCEGVLRLTLWLKPCCAK